MSHADSVWYRGFLTDASGYHKVACDSTDSWLRVSYFELGTDQEGGCL